MLLQTTMHGGFRTQNVYQPVKNDNNKNGNSPETARQKRHNVWIESPIFHPLG